MKPAVRSTLWSVSAGFRARYLAAIGAMAVGTVFLLLVPYVIQHMLDAVARGEAPLWRVLIPGAALIVALNAVHGFFTYVRGRWAAAASDSAASRCRPNCRRANPW